MPLQKATRTIFRQYRSIFKSPHLRRAGSRPSPVRGSTSITITRKAHWSLPGLSWRDSGLLPRGRLDKPGGALLVRLVNVFNLFFLLVVNPLASISLIARRTATIDPTHFTLVSPRNLLVLETAGLALYVEGFLLMAWALITLGRSYQLGGSAPRSEDEMVMSGPYQLIRHPMYTSALSISLGLALLIQSWAFFCVFCIFAALILRLIPIEEAGLGKAYGERYVAYQQVARKLIPFVY